MSLRPDIRQVFTRPAGRAFVSARTAAHNVAPAQHGAAPFYWGVICPSGAIRHAVGDDTLARIDDVARHTSLNLRERQQDVSRQPPLGCGLLKGLRGANTRYLASIDTLDQLGKIHQRTRQTIDLVTHNLVDWLILDIGMQPFLASAFSCDL